MSTVFNSSKLKSAIAFGNRNREIIRTWISVGSAGIATITYFTLHTFFMDKYKEIVQMYNECEPAKLSSQLQELADETFKEAHVSARYKLLKSVNFFPVVGIEPFSIGNLNTSKGILVGIPYNFNYKTKEDIKTKDIKIMGETDPNASWRSQAGQQLLDSLILSDNAKKFAIAKEIHLNDNFRLHGNTIIMALCCLFGTLAPGEIIDRFRLNRRSFATKSLIHLACYATAYIVWRLYYDAMNHFLQLNADQLAAEQGVDYYEGAIEFYRKTLQRHKACRTLFGEKGAQFFDSDGEIKSILRFKNVPIRTRLAKLSDLRSTVESINEVTE